MIGVFLFPNTELAKADINALDKATRELTQIEEDLSAADAINSEKASIICPESEIEALGGCGEDTSEQLQANLKRLKLRLQQESQR
ncbi:hypothetical protein HanOQP8_Chr01g0034671 [Helianthus annuus]|nr:hypothetical protein HanOQP8_Chr01g0034671 [Helianthus annuus]